MTSRRHAVLLAVVALALAAMIIGGQASAASPVTEANYNYMTPLALGAPQVVGGVCVMPVQIVAPNEDLLLTVWVTNNDPRPVCRAMVITAAADGSFRCFERDVAVPSGALVSLQLRLSQIELAQVRCFTLALWHENPEWHVCPSVSWFGVWYMP